MLQRFIEKGPSKRIIFQAFYPRDCNFSDVEIKKFILFKRGSIWEFEGGRSYSMEGKNMNAGFSFC